MSLHVMFLVKRGSRLGQSSYPARATRTTFGLPRIRSYTATVLAPSERERVCGNF